MNIYKQTPFGKGICACWTEACYEVRGRQKRWRSLLTLRRLKKTIKRKFRASERDFIRKERIMAEILLAGK